MNKYLFHGLVSMDQTWRIREATVLYGLLQHLLNFVLTLTHLPRSEDICREICYVNRSTYNRMQMKQEDNLLLWWLMCPSHGALQQWTCKLQISPIFHITNNCPDSWLFAKKWRCSKAGVLFRLGQSTQQQTQSLWICECTSVWLDNILGSKTRQNRIWNKLFQGPPSDSVRKLYINSVPHSWHLCTAEYLQEYCQRTSQCNATTFFFHFSFPYKIIW